MADNSNPKAAWPKTPDGTTDWQYVFEDANAGFIPLLARAPTAEMLQASATIIITKLFTRKNDETERDQLLFQLNEIISHGGELPLQIEAVTHLMRAIKDDRIEKARVYINRKHAGAAIDRRSGILWKIAFLLKPQVLVPAGVLMALALAGLVYMMLGSAMLGGADVALDVPAAEEAAAEEEASAEEEAAPEEPVQTELKPVLVRLKTVRWPLMDNATTDKPQYYSVTLTVLGWENKVETCRAVPKVMDAIYVAFDQNMPKGRPMREDETVQLQNVIRDKLNGFLPGDLIREVAVARYGTKGFKAAVLPPFCESPNESELSRANKKPGS